MDAGLDPVAPSIARLGLSPVTRVSPCHVDKEIMHSEDGNGWCEEVLLATEKYRRDCPQQYDNSTQHRAKLHRIHNIVSDQSRSPGHAI